MSDTLTTTAPADVLSGLIDETKLCEQLKCVPRTAKRYRDSGMPYIRLGNTIYYEPSKVRTWILSKENRPEQPRRGRPRKSIT